MSTGDPEGKPPVFSRWRGWYLLLAAFTVLQFLVYWIITNRLNHPF